jgi:hypothetical protein
MKAYPRDPVYFLFPGDWFHQYIIEIRGPPLKIVPILSYSLKFLFILVFIGVLAKIPYIVLDFCKRLYYQKDSETLNFLQVVLLKNMKIVVRKT